MTKKQEVLFIAVACLRLRVAPLPDASLFTGTSSTPRRRRSWWSTTSSWRPTWPTGSSCLTEFPPRRRRPTRKTSRRVGAASARRDANSSFSLRQASESAGRDEPLPVAAGDHVQERSEQLQAEDQQTELHQGDASVIESGLNRRCSFNRSPEKLFTKKAAVRV